MLLAATDLPYIDAGGSQITLQGIILEFHPLDWPQAPMPDLL